jgi:hypothetical protein
MNHKDTTTHESDERTLLDFGDAVAADRERAPENDLEATIVRVQRVLQGENNVHQALPRQLRTRIWEDIMASTVDQAEQEPANPWLLPATAKPARWHGAAIDHTRYQRKGWTRAANIALAIVILLAGLGVWKTFGGDLGSGGNDDPPTVPGLALQPSTPETSEIPAIVPSPVATPEPITACDLSADTPYFTDVMQSPVETTSLYVTPRNEGTDDPTGTLMLHCPDEPDDIELAKRIIAVGPGPVPGILNVWLMPEGSSDPGETHPAYVNLRSGQLHAFGRQDAAQSNLAYAYGSPWIIGPAIDDPSSLQMLDVRTMESTDLSSLTGAPILDGAQVTATGARGIGTFALALGGPWTGPSIGGNILRDTGMPGDIMVVEGSLDRVRWITVPELLEYVRNIWLSPDGSTIALSVYDGPTQFDDTLSYALISAEDGSLLGQSGPIETPGNPLALWIQKGTAIAFAADNTVQVLQAEPNAQPEIVLEPGQEISGVRTTTSPDIVVATVRQDHGSDADPASTDVDKVISVNVATGETHEFEGMEIGNIISWITSTNALLMYDFAGMSPGTVTIRVYDPVSGSLIQEIPDVPNPNDTGSMAVGKNSFTIADDGGTMVYTFGTQNIHVVKMHGGTPVVEQISPPSAATSAATVMLSPDGTLLSLVSNGDESRTRWLLDLTEANAEWLEVPNEAVSSDPGTIMFVDGMGD